MLGMEMTASGFLAVAGVLVLPINPLWATGGTVRRVVPSDNAALRTLGRVGFR